jgi:DEAD/DEAH box helicase domain-containing protein
MRTDAGQTAALYIYGKYPGGAGLAEALASRCSEMLATVLRSLAACPCKSGCPSSASAPAWTRQQPSVFLEVCKTNKE